MDEKLPTPSPEQEHRRDAEGISRRTFLMGVGIALNAIVGIAIATPVVVYLMGPVLRRKEYRHWIAVGDVTEFRRMFRRMCGARLKESLWCLRLTARTWDARSGGFPSRSCLCVLATAACITRMEAGLRGRRSAGCLLMTRRLKTGR